MSNDLYEMTKNIWKAKNCEELSARWASELEDAKKQAETITRFHQWSPLKVFTSLSSARKPQPVFSVRYQGQEVAEIIAEAIPTLSIRLKHETNNLKSFKLVTKSGKYSWKSSEATKFRMQFMELSQSPSNPKNMKSDEAWLQSVVFDTMVKTGEAGYHASLPVLFDRFPFQCPVPISANRGVPKESKGNLDILARRGQGGTHPAIWELKKPNTCKTAFEQAYIYGVTLALMLRHKGGDSWFRSMGFTKILQQKSLLNIDIIVAVTRDRENELISHINNFNDSMKLKEENATLNPIESPSVNTESEDK